MELLGVRELIGRRTLVQVVAGIVVGVYALGLWGSGVAVEAEWLRFYSVAVLVAGAMLLAWDRWLWRLPIFTHSAAVPPVLHGTWSGVLTSLWLDPESGESPTAKPAYLVVRQTASTVAARLYTDQGASASTTAEVRVEGGTYVLAYLYLSSPDPTFTAASPMHHGSTLLTITGSKPIRLRGRYWTDRQSRGELDFTEHSNKLAGDFDEATELFA